MLEFVDGKVGEALEFGSLSGPEIEQKGSDLSKFTLLEATYEIGQCKCQVQQRLVSMDYL